MKALIGLAAALIGIVLYDVFQKKHTVIRNFPVIGHLRYLLESFGPELRQYIFTSNDEERPFSRDERRWVYATAKRQNPYFGFGSDNDLDSASNYMLIKHSAFPIGAPEEGDAPDYPLACSKILGGARNRRRRFRPASVVNISGMSFGSLSRNAVEALNKGARIANCLHNTGEGGIADCHLHGGDLVWQIGTGYFGCRDESGAFSLGRFKERVEECKVKAIEIKLSQGAKPGLGGVLLATDNGGETWETCSRRPRLLRRSRASEASRWAATASARTTTLRSAASTACSTSSSFSQPSPACPSESSRLSEKSDSGRNWRK